MNERIRTGDTVLIVAGEDGYTYSAGKTGKVSHVSASGTVFVRLDGVGGPVVRAAKVEKVDPIAEELRRAFMRRWPSAHNNHIHVAAEEKPVEAEVLIDVRRAQAAKVAHEILGEIAELKDLIALAEYLVGVTPVPGVVEEVELIAQAPVAEPENITLTDKDGDVVLFEVANEPGEVAFVKCGSSGGGAWLSGENLDRAIEFLTQVRAARRA